MPRKPRKNRTMRRPGPGASMETKKKYYRRENERMEREGSRWRFGVSSADDGCICLIAAESYDGDLD